MQVHEKCFVAQVCQLVSVDLKVVRNIIIEPWNYKDGIYPHFQSYFYYLFHFSSVFLPTPQKKISLNLSMRFTRNSPDPSDLYVYNSNNNKNIPPNLLQYILPLNSSSNNSNNNNKNDNKNKYLKT
jgi:hypothetical protein